MLGNETHSLERASSHLWSPSLSSNSAFPTASVSNNGRLAEKRGFEPLIG